MIVFIFITLIIGLMVVDNIFDHIERKELALERGKPNFDIFAKQFENYNVDKEIIKEVYSSVQRLMGSYNGFPFPIEANDSLKNFYKIDPLDIDDIYFEIAKKLKINTDSPELNPLYNKVDTVKDLILFLNYQKNHALLSNNDSIIL